MSTGVVSTHRSKSSNSIRAFGARQTPPLTTITPDNQDAVFEPCAATSTHFLYAQRNIVLVLQHGNLTIARRLELHREDVLWIAVDNASERSPGRMAVSYDAGNTAIVWDIILGSEIARFSAYESMRVASFMRNGNIAFGNEQGNIILFEPSTSEHISARTIFDPITAIAPSADCRTFAIGYLNGSILIATLQPSFTILHTLTTTRAPSRITNLAWHGSSSKQKTDMLATQTRDGDLRVWSVPKPPHQEPPAIIRVLQRPDVPQPGPCWFAWSKNGRIVQHADGETRSWDVRTKKVTWETIPTVDNVLGIANYGPNATLFTLSRGHYVQQYNITPGSVAMQVASVLHAPANTPPTPPQGIGESSKPYAQTRSAAFDDRIIVAPLTETESSADEGAAMSPLQKIQNEFDSLDALKSELRDKVMPLSPSSSRTSSVSSRSSGRSGRRGGRKYLYDPPSSRASNSTGMDGTEFSSGVPSIRAGHESLSIHSVSSYASHSRYSGSQQVRTRLTKSPESSKGITGADLFPHTRARLQDVPFRTPHYGNVARTPDLLQREMLSVVFGWNDSAKALIRDELERHTQGSASGVLLAKWLGEGQDSMASMIGSESMTSSDWMLLALSSIGADSQKKVGEAFVQRLLEKGDINPAVAILLGLGEIHDAIEVYVSQGYWLEAVLLTCLTCPADWGRTSFLIRKWGESAVRDGQAELAVRCLSCTSIETSEPWFSPRAQDSVYAAQQERFAQPLSAAGTSSPPLSPPSRSGSQRLTAMNASLKLITTFGDKGLPASSVDVGVTPIAQSALQSALSPTGPNHLTARLQSMRDPSSARTATPGGYSRKKRLPSKAEIEWAKEEAAELATPMTTVRDMVSPVGHRSRRTSDPAALQEVITTAQNINHIALHPMGDQRLPSPAPGGFGRLVESSHQRRLSRDRKSDGLAVQVVPTRHTENVSPGPSISASNRSLPTGDSQASAASSSNYGGGLKGGKARAIDAHVSSVEEARELAREKRVRSRGRGESRRRDESVDLHTRSRAQDISETRGRHDAFYIKPGKRSPSSPVPMSPEEVAQASQATQAEPATTDDESFYKITSPVESHRSLRSARSEAKSDRQRPLPEGQATKNRQRSPHSIHLKIGSGRGRSQSRKAGSATRSPSSPLPLPSQCEGLVAKDADSDGRRVRLRSESRGKNDLQTRRARSRSRPGLLSSSKTTTQDDALPILSSAQSEGNSLTGALTEPAISTTTSETGRPRGFSRKELAARELEERRLSLARRPSVPAIPHPGDLSGARPSIGLRAYTDLGHSPSTSNPPYSRSQTVDPEQTMRYNKLMGTSAPIGLPATPRAMKNPRYMGSDISERDTAPPVPDLPEHASQLSSLGSLASHPTWSTLSSNVSQMASNVSQMTSNVTQATSGLSPAKPEADDGFGLLLPSTTFVASSHSVAPSRTSSAPANPDANLHYAYKLGLTRSNHRMSASRGDVRKTSPSDVPRFDEHQAVASIDEALAGHMDEQIIIVPVDSEQDEKEVPPILPELQHLATPPPPPPPPNAFAQQVGAPRSSGVISIAIDGSGPVTEDVPTTLPSITYPQPMERAATASPSTHRRGKSGSVTEGIGSRFFKMRSSSRSRTKASQVAENTKAVPYETVLPSFPAQHSEHESDTRVKSPYEQAMALGQTANYDASQQRPPPPPPLPGPFAPPGGLEGRWYETAIPPSSLPVGRSQSAVEHRNPKDLRANMPPDILQPSSYVPPPPPPRPPPSESETAKTGAHKGFL